MSPTPGPWTNNGLKDMWCFQVVDTHGLTIADVHIKTTFREDVEEAEATANCIAAAPKLLTACKRAKELLVPEVKKEPDLAIFWELVDAINAAEGKS